MAGSYGHIGCYSMDPMKVFTTYGEAGAVESDDDKIFENLLSLGYNGTLNRDYNL
tara:strand:+ start:464 stop:628 length:165 start_codon:yes stop_codon:yes gene_type:complete